jgi:hypothetical protein
MLGGKDAVGDPNSEIPDSGADQMFSYDGRSFFFTAVKAAGHTKST